MNEEVIIDFAFNFSHLCVLCFFLIFFILAAYTEKEKKLGPTGLYSCFRAALPR